MQRMYDLPKILWTHWDSDNIPDLCRLCIERTRHILYDWDVRLLTTSQFLTMCTPPPEFVALTKQHQADFIRIWLLKEYGGTWMDISIVLNQSLNALHDESVATQADCTGFYLDGFTTNKAYPVFENWFIMAPKDSRFIALWYEEFHKAVTMGFLNYKKQALSQGVDPQRIFNGENDTYLTMHLCYQVVIQKKMRPNILYKKAEDTMYLVHDKCEFKEECMREEFKKSYVRDIPYIKLRGGDRKLFPAAYFKETDFWWWVLLFCMVIGICFGLFVFAWSPAASTISGKRLSRLFRGQRRTL